MNKIRTTTDRQDHGALQDQVARLQKKVDHLNFTLVNQNAREDKLADLLFFLLDSRIEAKITDILQNEGHSLSFAELRGIVGEMISDGELAIKVQVKDIAFEAHAELT